MNSLMSWGFLLQWARLKCLHVARTCLLTMIPRGCEAKVSITSDWLNVIPISCHKYNLLNHIVQSYYCLLRTGKR